MDTKAYIESGIIESYVLGLASEEEASELEMLCQQHEDIKNAVDAFALLVEKYALNNAITPPVKVKDELMFALAPDFARAAETNVTHAPVVPLYKNGSEKTRSSSFLRYVVAASVILLIASIGLNFYFYNNYRQASDRYQALLVERNSLQANNNAIRTRLSDFEESVQIMQNPDVRVVTLKGVPGKEFNLAAVYWDNKTKNVYFLPTKMDAIPADKQYQLWAIVDGKPVDAGLVGDCNGLCKMKNIPNAQAFAITLEQKGGSPAPTLSAMYVMGNV